MARIKKTHITGNDVSWQKAFNMYIADKERYNLSDYTIRNSTSIFNAWNKTFDIDANAVSVSEAASHTFEEFVDAMRAQGLKTLTINTRGANIQSFFYWLYDHNFIPDKRRFTRLKMEDTLPRFLSEDEVSALLTSPYNRNDFVEVRTYTLIALMLATGIRVGSVPDIELADWDRQNKTLLLRKTKTRKQQMIYLPTNANDLLEAYYFDFLGEAQTKYLFPNYNGGKITTRALQIAYANFCKARGVENIKIHSLRHTFATNWVRQGGNLYKLQKAMNHRSQVSTLRYARLFDEDVARDFEQLSILNDYIAPKQRITKKGRKR